MTSKQEFNCVFCKDVFNNKEDLQEHFRKHGDPKYKNRFEVDPQASDEKSREKVEMVSCDVCSQVFPTISKAITHKHKVHPDHDAKYFCPWCGKLFTMKHLYNVHVQSSHANQEKTEEKCFRCDSCSVDFFIPSAMINHNKFFHRQDTDLPDVGQSKKIKYYKQEVIPIYYCAFCGEEYENKVNLIKHISDDHGDENQSPDEVLKCPMCDAVFYHLDAYEIHLTFHSSEDVYSVKNSEFDDLLDYSLETVPPIIEKVTNLETEDHNQDTDPESTMNAVGIEKFLELAMDQSEDSHTVKVKKHKKHKKSKKAAITLDEFLSMNKDVFGEGLDFQGIEEVPTRVVKKQLKNNKKSTNSVVTSAELDKLKKAGIVIKRKVERDPLKKSIKVATSMPNKSALNKPVYKINKVREIETSSEVLTKLINQSNNQIKIVKKVNPNTAINEPNEIINDFPTEETKEVQDNVKEITDEHEHKTDEIPDNAKADEDNTKDSLTPNSKILLAGHTNDPLSQSSAVVKETENMFNTCDEMKKTSEIQDSEHSPLHNKICVESAKVEDTEQDKNEHDEFGSDTEFENTENNLEPDTCIKNDKSMDSRRVSNDKNSNQDSILSTSTSSLSTLKRLSHLTVKSISQNKSDMLAESTINDRITAKDNQTSHNDSKEENSNTPIATDKACLSKPKNLVEKDPTMDAFKTLGKHITIKSLSSKRNIDVSDPEDHEMDDYEGASNLKLEDVSNNKNVTIKKIKVEISEPKLNSSKIINSLHSQEKKCVHGKKVIGKSVVSKIPSKVTVEKPDNSLPTSNANILKRLPNITTKPIMNKSNCPSPAVKKANMAKNIIQTEQKQEEIIEIFDIDDSEDEDDNNSKPQPSENSMKSMDALKNLSKNITVKSLNQQPGKQNIKIENNIKLEKEDSNSQNKFKSESNIDALINMQNRNMGFQNMLQGLSKNITVKSRNTSASQFITSQEHNTQHSKVFEDDDGSGSDISENIKITELDEDMDDSEDNSEMPAKSNTTLTNPIVESPHESCSDNEHIDEDIHDFETDIKVSTVQKSNQTMNSTINSVCLNNLKNISKNITIKSLSNKNSTEDDSSKEGHDSRAIPQIQKKTIPTKTSRQVVNEFPDDNMSINRISKTFDHNSTQPLNKKVSAMNQVSSVNKEVTVKTIQTKTVIQEITTTVTKTIKTVNQTMKQEVRNTFQTNTPMVAQRIQGMKPSPSKNLQGVVIRHASPIIGARASNTITPIRPANTVVRPSKQIVPVRPGINLARPNNQTMAIGKKVTPSPSPNSKPVIGRPLKVSPTAMASATVKRINTEDVSGPFSCFKKPKESLIPVSDIPTFANTGTDVTAHFTSASHTSSSNFTSTTTKVVKGNAVVSAKQVKSEINATSQQLSRLNNVTGIKIMTSQQKQSQVQEKSESSPMKRTTLEAIQRLQKQGLLVKKPRPEVNEDNEGPDNDGDNNAGYNSDEHDE